VKDLIRRHLFPLFVVLAGGLFVAELFWGTSFVSARDVVAALSGRMSPDAGSARIVIDVRLPRAVSALLCGAALSVSGILMQTLFRNPLAGPDVLGVTSGASLGVALSILGAKAFAGFGASPFLDLGLGGGAILGALLSMSVVLAAARHVRDGAGLLVFGVMFGFAVSALVSVLLSWALPDQVQRYVAWGFGSFASSGWDRVRGLGVVMIVALAASIPLMKPCNALLLGETYAASLGVDVGFIRVAVICVASVLAGLTTALSGPVAFIGIAAPHMCRMMASSTDHRIVLPLGIAAGGVVALLADLGTRLGGATVIPLNVVTSLLGAPFIIWLILAGGKRGRT